MVTHELIRTKEAIELWLQKHQIQNYTLNSDMSVDVEGHVNLNQRSLKRIPVQFNRVSGNFNCAYNRLTSLFGAPHEIEGNFNCSHNRLSSLTHGPQKVAKNYDCSNNQLTSLRDSPQQPMQSFFCQNNSLSNLQNGPFEVSLGYHCDHNQLTSLIGAPKKVAAFSCDCNFLTSLCDGPTEIGHRFSARDNKIEHLRFLPLSSDTSIYFFDQNPLLGAAQTAYLSSELWLIHLSEVEKFELEQQISLDFCGKKNISKI